MHSRCRFTSSGSVRLGRAAKAYGWRRSGRRCARLSTEPSARSPRRTAAPTPPSATPCSRTIPAAARAQRDRLPAVRRRRCREASPAPSRTRRITPGMIDRSSSCSNTRSSTSRKDVLRRAPHGLLDTVAVVFCCIGSIATAINIIATSCVCWLNLVTAGQVILGREPLSRRRP